MQSNKPKFTDKEKIMALGAFTKARLKPEQGKIIWKLIEDLRE